MVIHDGKLILADGHHRVAAARLAKIEVPYDVVDEAWIVSNTGWSSIVEMVEDSLQLNAFRLNEQILRKAGFR